MSTEPIPTTQPESETTDIMDVATQELSAAISEICKKYNAEFIVQKVIFSFVPKLEESTPKTEL